MNRRYEKVFRVIVTGKAEERSEAFKYLDRNGYYIIRSGPKMVGLGLADVTRFKIVAERSGQTRRKEVRGDERRMPVL
jgi:hypothetical protein